MNETALAAAFGTVYGAMLAVIALVASATGWSGEIFSLYSSFFPGYRPGARGSAVGLLWGALFGGMFGLVLGVIYNQVASKIERR